MRTTPPTRRRFLQATTAGAALLGLDGLGFLSQLRPVSAEEARIDPKLVKLDDSIEPTVRLLEETPRDKLLEEVADRVRKGLSYRELLTALQLAGVRNIQPRPHVGFKFHAVLVVNSAHLASLASPDSDRWLPIFWALDYFKSSQAATVKESGWRMAPVDEAKVPSAEKAREAFTRAMDEWDETAADAAAAGVARACSMNEAFDLFARYGPRDFRDIGHKAIYVSNAFRTLQVIGWQHAEPVLRSLAYALQATDGQNPAKNDLDPDRPWKHNAELAAKVHADWQNGKPDDGATRQLLSTLRNDSADDSAGHVAQMLNDGVSPRSVHDALLCGAGELLMRKPGIVSLHSVTSSNALRYAYASRGGEARERLMLLLQNASFIPLFRGQPNPNEKAIRVDEFEPVEPKDADGAVAEVFADAGHDRATAAAKALAYLKSGHDPKALIHAGRRLVFMKGTDAHDYKFSSAVLEDYYQLSPAWRDRYLASSLFYLPSSGAKDNALVTRTRAALGA
jgi:hypothetical protein